MQAVSGVYTIPQENLDLCATIGQIARERIAPRSAEIDERGEYPWDIRKVLSEQDILGLPFPTEYGGTGTGTATGTGAGTGTGTRPARLFCPFALDGIINRSPAKSRT